MLVPTDSGGVQDETSVLGVPCLTFRDSIERPVTITEGTNRLVGELDLLPEGNPNDCQRSDPPSASTPRT